MLIASWSWMTGPRSDGGVPERATGDSPSASSQPGQSRRALAGYAVCPGEGATAVVTLDGDGQHEPEDIPALITYAPAGSLAIVIGARLHACTNIPWLRYLANRVANFWISWAAGSRIPDSQSGFRLYPTTVLNAVGSLCDPTSGFVFESELLIEAGRKGVPIRTVPVSAIYGRHSVTATSGRCGT